MIFARSLLKDYKTHPQSPQGGRCSLFKKTLKGVEKVHSKSNLLIEIEMHFGAITVP